MVLFSTAFFMVFLAELGDKTQLIAMMFATRYPWPKVILGILFASLANHLLAITAGYYLNGLLNTHLTQIITAAIFLICGILMLRKENEETHDSNPAGKSIILTVFSIFFLGEFGDKTQLAAFTLSAQTGHSIWLICLGTTAAMVTASCLSIFLGNCLRNYIKESYLQKLGAILFLLLGCHGFYNYFMG